MQFMQLLLSFYSLNFDQVASNYFYLLLAKS